MRYIVFAACLTWLIRTALSDNDEFKQPPSIEEFHPNPVYPEGQIMELKWETHLDDSFVGVWQKYPTTKWYWITKNTTEKSTFWTAIRGDSMIPAGETPVFQATLYSNASTWEPTAKSCFFNVSLAGKTSETSSNNSTLSKSAVAGIAVGATVGAILIFAGMAFMIWKCMRSPKRHSPPNQLQEIEEKKPPSVPSPSTADRRSGFLFSATSGASSPGMAAAAATGDSVFVQRETTPTVNRIELEAQPSS